VLGAIFHRLIDSVSDLPQGRHSRCRGRRGGDAWRGRRARRPHQGNVAAFASANGLKGAIYGVIIVVFVLFEPLGLYGRWLEDETLLPAVSALQARHLQTAEDLCEIGAQPVSYFRAENLSLHFGRPESGRRRQLRGREGRDIVDHRSNGAGKSSIFNLISGGIYNPTSGRIYFEDEDITQEPAFGIAKLGIARTFQNIGTVRERDRALHTCWSAGTGIPPPSFGRNCCFCRACAPPKKSIAAGSSR